MRRDEIVVVGGGVAGIAASLTARGRGASVTLIDEQSAVGGYMRWTIGVQPDLPGDLAGKRGFELAEAGWNMLYDSGVNVQNSSTAWGLFEERVLGVVNPESSYQLQGDQVILATGSTDVTVPFPGWELAGVMTARAALIALNIHRAQPGRKVALVGDGLDASEVRESLEMAGVEIIVHATDLAGFTAGGDGVIEWVADGASRSSVDAVITVFGTQPDPALALQALVDTGYSALSGVHVPLRSDDMETSLPGVFVVGDAAGICSTAEACAEGMVAAEAAVSGDGLDEARRSLERLRSTERRAELNRLRPEVSVS